MAPHTPAMSAVSRDRTTVKLRALEQGDMEFAYRVYAASREREMALLPHWSEAEKDAFLRDQFRLQDHHYRSHYPEAHFQLIMAEGEPMGRMYVAQMPGETRLMDIALLPEYRGQGIGAQLVTALMHQAGQRGDLVSLHVEEDNPAMRLYRRLGFKVAGEASVYKLMHWRADRGPGSSAPQDHSPLT